MKKVYPNDTFCLCKCKSVISNIKLPINFAGLNLHMQNFEGLGYTFYPVLAPICEI